MVGDSLQKCWKRYEECPEGPMATWEPYGTSTARTRNDTFNNHNMAYKVSARLDDLLAAISLVEEDPACEARGVLRKMRFCDPLDEILEAIHPDWTPEYCQFDLNQRRARLAQLGNTHIWVNYLSPSSSIQVLPHGWFDPRENLDRQDFNDQPTWIGFRGMEEFYDHLVEVGMNGPSARISPVLATVSPPDLEHQENPKIYEDTTSTIQVFGDLWWSMKIFGAPASMSIVVSEAELCVYEVHHKYVNSTSL
ncbi:hypothetical protein B0H13DRAFT_1905597 [Mycena leptocephala]|nr:hypothetical protein B0H13DRAFT_1905597 [Mycena leptocephala]